MRSPSPRSATPRRPRPEISPTHSSTDMFCNGLGVLAVLASLLVSSSAFPEEQAAGDSLLQKLLSRRDGAPQDSPASRPRAERRAHLSEEEREVMTKQLVHAISEMMNSECMSDRDYQGWVDFGRRREAEMP